MKKVDTKKIPDDFLERLARRVSKFDLKKPEALEAHIRANWKIREILLFDYFTHGGTYDAGKGWRINFAGYVADTAEEQRNLIGVFEGLCYEAYFFMGMRRYAEMRADVPPVVGWTRLDTGENSPLAKTLNALIRSIPSKKAKEGRAK